MFRDGNKPQSDTLLSTIGTVSGVASLVLAVAGNNLEKLSLMQRWGLAGISVVMLFSFLAGLVLRQSMSHHHAGRNFTGAAALLVGGLVGGGMLLVLVPFFSFGLAPSDVEMVSMSAAGLFASVFAFVGFASLAARRSE